MSNTLVLAVSICEEHQWKDIWRRIRVRWFFRDGHELKYFASREDKVPKGTINLYEAHRIAPIKAISVTSVSAKLEAKSRQADNER